MGSRKGNWQTKYFAPHRKETLHATPVGFIARQVVKGPRWETVNSFLHANLLAFKRSIEKGHASRFAIGSKKNQNTLTLQFTAAGVIVATRRRRTVVSKTSS